MSFVKYVTQLWQDHAQGVYEFSAAKAEHIEAGLVTATTPATKPTPGGENSVTLGESGVSRAVAAAVVGNGSATTFKIPHGLGNLVPGVSIWKEKGTGGSETTPSVLTLIKEVKVLSENEIELVFATAPGKKEVFWVQIDG